MAVCVCDCIPKHFSDLRGLQMFKLTMKIKYFPYQKLAFLMNCAGVSEGDMEILAFSGFCLVFTPLLPGPLSPSLPLPGCLSSLQPLAPTPASFFLLREGGRHKENDVLAPVPSSSSVSLHRTTTVLVLPPMYHRFSPNLWAVGLPNFGYRVGGGGKEQHPDAVLPYHQPGQWFRVSRKYLYTWEGKRKLMLNHNFSFVFQSPHSQCQTVVLHRKMRRKDLWPRPEDNLLDVLRFLGSSSCEQYVSYQCVTTVYFRRGRVTLLYKQQVHSFIPSYNR